MSDIASGSDAILDALPNDDGKPVDSRWTTIATAEVQARYRREAEKQNAIQVCILLTVVVMLCASAYAYLKNREKINAAAMQLFRDHWKAAVGVIMLSVAVTATSDPSMEKWEYFLWTSAKVSGIWILFRTAVAKAHAPPR